MIFINDLAAGFDWLTPAPIGTVEPGWVGIVSDMLRDIGAAVATSAGTTLDVLALAERDGELVLDAVVDGPGAGDPIVVAIIEAAATSARTRAVATCPRCGRPASLRRDRPTWSAMRCDRHAPRCDPSSDLGRSGRNRRDRAEANTVAMPE